MNKIHLFGLLLFLAVFASCEDKLGEYYEKPEWLKGNIYQILQEDGKYTIFLKGIDLAGYKQMVNGKSILTVMAPSDSAFQIYLQEKYQTQKIEDLSVDEIRKLIGFHIMYYAFSTDKLVNFRPGEGDDATFEELLKNAGLYYKHRTKSMDKITVEWDKTRGDSVKVFHQERFLPVFSTKFFNTKQIDANYNYEYFFPGTNWTGGDSGFNVANASVQEYQVIASNGYVFKVDKVIRPLETIYTELKSKPEYSTFISLYNKYEYYAEEPDLSLQYGNGSKLFQHYHKAPLANIACEWPVIDYSNMTSLSYASYSVFAPNNKAISDFFNNYWKIGGYDSLPQVSSESIEYLLFNCVYSESVVFPEEIQKGRIKNSYGTVVSFDVDKVPAKNRIMCVNGALYGLDELAAPTMFTSVTGPAFQYKKYGYFLKMLKASNLTMTLCSDETRYITLMPSNAQIESIGITTNRDGNLIMNGALLSSSVLTNYVYAHTVSLDATPGNYSQLPTTGNHVLRTLSPTSNMYWYVKDGKITNNVLFNEMIFPGNIADENRIFRNVEELKFKGESWTNGKSYSYDSLLFEGAYTRSNYKNFQGLMYNNRSDVNLPYHGFVQLLQKAGMYNAQTFNFIFEDYIAFVPVTDAVKNALLNNNIPGIKADEALIANEAVPFFDRFTVTDAEQLKQYLLAYFIPESTAGVSNYPFLGWGEVLTKGLPTLDVKEVLDENSKLTLVTTMMDVQDTGSKLRVRLIKDGSSWKDVVNNYYYFPFVFEDGCVHFISNCF